MATTIITKNGSGAPLAGDLTAGELAVDLPNKRLYSKDSLGNVIELGTNAGSSTFADLTVSGDLTVDTNTLYVDSTNNRVGIGESSPSYLLDLKGGTNDSIRLNALSGAFIFANGSGVDKGSLSMSGGNMDIAADAGIDFYSGGSPLSGDPQVTLDSSGNVGIGETSPSTALDVLSANAVVASFNRTSSNSPQIELGNEAGGQLARIVGINGGGMFFGTDATGSGVQERMRIDSSGNVGIGESAPDGLLHLKSTAPDLILEDSDTGSAIGSRNRVRFRNGSGTFSAQIGNDPSIDGGVNFTLGTLVNYPVAIMANGSTKMVVKTDGNVGIGTSSPSSYNSVADNLVVGDVSGNNGITILSGTAEQGSLFFGDGTGTSAAQGIIRYKHSTNALELGTANTGDHLVIDSSGNLLVGTSGYVDFKQRVQQTANLGVCALVNTLSSGLTYDQFQILVQNAASSGFFFQRFYAAGGTPQFGVTGNGVIYAQNTSVQSISDARVKENVKDSEQGLDVITELRPVRFDFKEGFGNNQKNQLGFIAQEVEAVFPDAVMEASEKTEREEPLKSLGPAALIPVMVKAIQEQQAMIETLQAQVAELQGAN